MTPLINQSSNNLPPFSVFYLSTGVQGLQYTTLQFQDQDRQTGRVLTSPASTPQYTPPKHRPTDRTQTQWEHSSRPHTDRHSGYVLTDHTQTDTVSTF